MLPAFVLTIACYDQPHDISTLGVIFIAALVSAFSVWAQGIN